MIQTFTVELDSIIILLEQNIYEESSDNGK